MEFERFVQSERNILRYSSTRLSLRSNIPSNNYSSSIKPRSNVPASASLKSAMFKTSSKGMVTALTLKNNG